MASLVTEAAVLLDRFTSGGQCLDDFVEGASKGLQKMETHHAEFIIYVVSGCVKYKKLLEIVMDVFYGQSGKNLKKSDHSLYVIICYLTMFALEDLGLQLFGNIVRTSDVKKIHMFLTFFFAHLNTHIREEWNGVYGTAHVERHWIGPLLRWRPQIDALLDQLAVRITTGSLGVKAVNKTSWPKEFSPGKDEPQALPELGRLQGKNKPVKNSTCGIPEEMQEMGDVRPTNHGRKKELLCDANVKQLRCAVGETSELPQSNSWPVKLNGAAILRQGALYTRQLEEELQRVKGWAEGAREPSSFLQWQKKMREKDLQEELARAECRRLQGRLSYEEAVISRARAMADNQRRARIKKEEAAQLMQKYAEERLEKEKEMRHLVQRVADGHGNSKTAREELQKIKKTIVKEVSKENRDLLSRALEEEQAKLHRKFEMIDEIRAIESLPHNRVGTFDDTETAGHELLGEMSLSELKERLALLKEAQQTQQQQRREHIVAEKHNRKQLLLQQLDAIDLHQRATARAAAFRKDEAKGVQGPRPEATRVEEVLVLQKKLQEKLQERKQRKKSQSSEIRSSKQEAAQISINADTSRKGRSEEKSWKDLERSLEQHIQAAAP